MKLGEHQDEYAWILPNDITERLEIDGKNTEEYLEIFGYLPEGAEIENVIDSAYGLYLKVIITEKYMNLRIYSNNKPTIDFKHLTAQKINLDGTEIERYSNENVDTYIWTNTEKMYRLYGDVDKTEMIKIIENMNYEKIEKFF